jgi:hypothetical protein
VQLRRHEGTRHKEQRAELTRMTVLTPGAGLATALRQTAVHKCFLGPIQPIVRASGQLPEPMAVSPSDSRLSFYALLGNQVQVQVCFTSVCGQVQPLDVALSNSV